MESNFAIKLAVENSTATQFKKFNKGQWNQIEKVYPDPITNFVLEAMRKLGNEKTKMTNIGGEIHNTLKTCGDDIYINVIRPSLLKLKIIDREISIKTQNNIIKKRKIKKQAIN